MGPILHNDSGCLWIELRGVPASSELFTGIFGGKTRFRLDDCSGRGLSVWGTSTRPVLELDLVGGSGPASSRDRPALEELWRRLDLPFRPTPSELLWPMGWVGWIGYEAAAAAAGTPYYPGPLARLIFCDRAVVFSPQRGLTQVMAGRFPSSDSALAWVKNVSDRLLRPEACARPFSADTLARSSAGSWRWDDDAYLERIERLRKLIGLGQIYQACLTNTYTFADGEGEALAVYNRLRILNPTPFSAYFETGDYRLLSSSPEHFLTVKNSRVSASLIKGTRARADGEAQDFQAAEQLRKDPKERAENLMILDLMRNDLARVCQPTTLLPTELFRVQTLKTCHQLVSGLQARLRPGFSASDLLRSSLPPGSMTGAPKLRAMQILYELESGPRGPYAGVLGWWGLDGSMRLSVIIRSLIFTGTTVSLGSGGGLVWDSLARAELAEVKLKASSLIRAYGQ